jgi:putative FmdB family regulatory protein
MPIYIFECTTCGVQFERAQHMTDQTLPGCPNGHQTVHRVFTSPAVIFKGAGFYSTDHRQPEIQKKTRNSESMP